MDIVTIYDYTDTETRCNCAASVYLTLQSLSFWGCCGFNVSTFRHRKMDEELHWPWKRGEFDASVIVIGKEAVMSSLDFFFSSSVSVSSLPEIFDFRKRFLWKWQTDKKFDSNAEMAIICTLVVLLWMYFHHIPDSKCQLFESIDDYVCFSLYPNTQADINLSLNNARGEIQIQGGCFSFVTFILSSKRTIQKASWLSFSNIPSNSN